MTQKKRNLDFILDNDSMYEEVLTVYPNNPYSNWNMSLDVKEHLEALGVDTVTLAEELNDY